MLVGPARHVRTHFDEPIIPVRACDSVLPTVQEWFWRFKSAARERVHEKQAAAAVLRKEFEAIDKKAQQQYFEAKSELGLWSDAGVEEGRQLFWKAFESGKVFGRRQTFWDGLVSHKRPAWTSFQIRRDFHARPFKSPEDYKGVLCCLNEVVSHGVPADNAPDVSGRGAVGTAHTVHHPGDDQFYHRCAAWRHSDSDE